MKFFRKCFLPLFTVWLAFIVVFSPYVQSQMVVKALTIDFANWPTQLTGKCYTGEHVFDCDWVNGLPQQTLDYYITKWPILANSPWVSSFEYHIGSNANGKFFNVTVNVIVNITGNPFNMYLVEGNASYDGVGYFWTFGGDFVSLSALYSQKISGNGGEGTFSYTTYSYKTYNTAALGVYQTAKSYGIYGNEGVSPLIGYGYNIVAPVEFCTYTVPRETLKQSDIVALQDYDQKNGTSLASKAEQLSASVFDKYSAFTALFVPLVQELQSQSELNDIANRLTGSTSNNSWYKDDNGKIHSFGGGVSRGGGAGRDYTGGGNDTHTPTACFDQEQVTFLPVGDVAVTPNFTTPSASTTENIYYVTNEYYITNNYEIIEKIEKDPATDTDTPGTDTDIPPDVKPGDEWPEDTPSWIEFLGNLISGLLQGLGDAIAGLGSAIGGIANALATLVSSLIDALMDLIKMLFIPSDNFMSDKLTSMSETVKTKLPVFGQIEEIEHSIVGMLQGVSALNAEGNGAPSYVMQLPEWLGSGEFELFDFQFFEQYRSIFHAIISFCAWSLYLMRVPNKLANAIEKASK